MVHSKPDFSLVVPCYKVSAYLPAFLRSLDQQLVSADSFEVVFVVDGCPESSEQIIQAWRATTDVRSQLIITENQGVSAARTTGLSATSGRWITFPDPDDELEASYLAEIQNSLANSEGIDLIVSRLVRVDADLHKRNAHPLDAKYNLGTRDLDLRDEPNAFQIAVHTAFFRHEILTDSDITFDSRLKVFEDGKFVAEYLLASPGTVLRVCTTAFYYYKVRSNKSGALASSTNEFPDRYSNSLRYAYAELIEIAGTDMPRWLENIILYDLYWLFSSFMLLRHPIQGASRDVLSALSELTIATLKNISHEALTQFNVIRVRPEIRSAWLVSRLGPSAPKWVRIYRNNRFRSETEYRYFAGTTTDLERVLVDGVDVEPSEAKWRAVVFFGEVWLYERILWVRSGEDTTFRTLDNDSAEETFALGGRPKRENIVNREMGWNRERAIDDPRIPLRKDRPLARLSRHVKKIQRTMRRRGGWFLGKVSLLPPFSRYFRNVWLITDRDNQANDNGEALLRYIVSNRPSLNVQFVIDRKSVDYERLKRDRLPVIPLGGFRHFIALRNCSHLLSSHIDDYVVKPFRRYGLEKTWNYVFLQHGVTQGSLERWLNLKDVQLIVCATRPEANAFAADGTPYIFTRREVLLSGFSRHDILTKALNERSDSQKGTILLVPTWRNYLLRKTGAGNARGPIPTFASSKYVGEWSSVFNSDSLKSLADRHELEIVLLPHPNLEPHLDQMDIPEWVNIISYQGGAISEAIAAAAVTVTDYSSVVFDAAYCYAPTVYFQFDRDEFFGGGHLSSTGYFSYENDGFGPVVRSTDQVVSGIDMLLGASEQSATYQERVSELYPYRDGKASERVVTAVQTLGERRQ